MPLYGYACTVCGHTFDEFLSISNRNVPTENACPHCGEKTVAMSLNATPMADPVRLGHIKAPEGFRDVLRNVKDKFYQSKITVD